MADGAGEVTDLLQHLIRNECVNDGTPESGREVRSVDVLKSYLEGSGADLERKVARLKVDASLTKPIDPRRLLDLVGSRCGKG